MKKLVVITGASSGIGKELAATFTKQGHPVLMLARRGDVMENFHFPGSICRSVDVTDLNAVRQAVSEAEAVYGKTDLLINCAGLMLLGHADSQPYEEWEKMIDVNIKGVLTGTKAVLQDMISRKAGTIINISSIAGRKTFDEHAVYCASKYAVHAITESMRKEAAEHNVRICVIAPGVVETALLSHSTNEQIKEDYEQWKESIDGGMDVSRIAQCVRFIYEMPQDVCVREIVVSKTKQQD